VRKLACALCCGSLLPRPHEIDENSKRKPTPLVGHRRVGSCGTPKYVTYGISKCFTTS
jgi:hypothetical protein